MRQIDGEKERVSTRGGLVGAERPQDNDEKSAEVIVLSENSGRTEPLLGEWN